MRNKDRDMSSTHSDPGSERNWNGNIGSDSSRDDRMRNREEYSPDIDEEEEDLQERQREGNLGNERVRNSDR
jgi:hypothetical protein